MASNPFISGARATQQLVKAAQEELDQGNVDSARQILRELVGLSAATQSAASQEAVDLGLKKKAGENKLALINEKAKRAVRLQEEQVSEFRSLAERFGKGELPREDIKRLDRFQRDLRTQDPSLRRPLARIVSAARSQRKVFESEQKAARLKERRMASRLREAKRLNISKELLSDELLAAKPAEFTAGLRKIGRGRTIRRLGVGGGIAALALPILAKTLFGGQKDEQGIPPELKLALAQRLGQQQNQGGGIGGLDTSRTLNNISKLLGIIKLLQDQAGQAPVQQTLV